jgi:hypothetical protein
MQDVTEKAESSEPLLSEQLYDTLRRAGQMHTESLLQADSELVDRGFLAKASEVEQTARTNINELRQRVEHAAESVLGSQSETLRYAQNELKDLTKQAESGLGDTATNSTSPSGSESNSSAPSGAQANSSSTPGSGPNASPSGQQANGGSGGERLRELVQQIGSNSGGATTSGGSILGGGFANWADRMRDVEQVVDSVELRNRLAEVRERVAGFRAEYRLRGRKPPTEIVRIQVLQPMIEIGVQLQEDLARLENARSLVPLDHDPVPDNYSELVRKYYEKLGGGQ